MTRGNCCLWALRQFWRHGGYVAFRRGKDFKGWYLHFLWAKQLNGPWMAYCCKKEKPFPYPIFDGEVREGDDH